MSTFDFRNINLNLLPALDALLEERSVSRAAERMGVSQSAMSHSLARLRELLDDPLLVNAGREMAPTPNAERLAGPLRLALGDLHAALVAEGSFDAKTSEREVSIASFDYFEMTLLPEISAFLREQAPRLRLRIERVTREAVSALVAGELDLIIAGGEAAMPAAGIIKRTLLRDPFAVIARCDHPRIKKRLSLARYLELDHVLVALEGRAEGVVDQALRGQGKTRRVSLRVPHFMSAPLAVSRSDAVCTLPATIAERARDLFGVRVLAPPIDLPETPVAAFWSRRLDADPAHRWFRDQIFSGRALSASVRRRLSADPGS